jgi:biotin carboxyl carrier protein
MSPLHGEHVAVPERMIVAPGAGVFRPRAASVPTGIVVVEPDEEIGVLEGPGTVVPVRSPFRGRLMGMLASDGERLREGQPVAWLRGA